MLYLHHESTLYGAGERVRTVDLNLGKVALYQLSYARMREIPTTGRAADFSHSPIPVKGILDFLKIQALSAAVGHFRPCGP